MGGPGALTRSGSRRRRNKGGSSSQGQVQVQGGKATPVARRRTGCLASLPRSGAEAQALLLHYSRAIKVGWGRESA